MPVIECECGMVMSLPMEDSRIVCIRCGRTALRKFGRHDESADRSLAGAEVSNQVEVERMLPSGNWQSVSKRAATKVHPSDHL